MLVAIRPLLTEFGGRRAETPHGAGSARRRGCCGSPGRRWRWSSSAAPSTRASWPCATRRSGRPGTARELQAFLPIVHGKPVLYAGQDRYAAYELLGADTHVPLVEFPDERRLARTWRSRSTPATPTARSTSTPSRAATLERFPYVITGRAAWNSQAPANFKRIAADPLLRALGSGPGRRRDDRHVLLEGTEAGGAGRLRRAGDPHPARQPRPRLALPRRRDRPQSGLGRGQRPRHRRQRPRRRWTCRPGAGTSRSSTSPPST